MCTFLRTPAPRNKPQNGWVCAERGLFSWIFHYGGYKWTGPLLSNACFKSLESWHHGCWKSFLHHSLSVSLPPFLMTLPFCHVCGETYRVAAGFLFSGNVLDEWKATWSDLRDTTCRRFIISFPLFKSFWKVFVSSVGSSFWSSGHTKRI